MGTVGCQGWVLEMGGWKGPPNMTSSAGVAGWWPQANPSMAILSTVGEKETLELTENGCSFNPLSPDLHGGAPV